ncbi:hypothetical protein O5D80_002062 [Batrachochytrium dendrobatidis]|nr:hypothetical protein O5D80_002062 [Batrachochytrium dendrobatidis]
MYDCNIPMNSYVTFNVGGICLSISYKTLEEYPHSKLYELSHKSSSLSLTMLSTVSSSPQLRNKHEIYLDHNPLAFLCVLDYLRYKRVLIPRNVSLDVFKLQLVDLRIPFNDADILLGNQQGITLNQLQQSSSVTSSPPSTSYTSLTRLSGNDGAASIPDPPSTKGTLFGSRDDPPTYSSIDTACSSTFGIQSTTNQSMHQRISAFVTDRIQSVITHHAALGHKSVRIYILPSGIDREAIVSNTHTDDPNAMPEFLTLKTDYLNESSEMDFLLLPDSSRTLSDCIKGQTRVVSAETEARHITVRRENSFGLFESTSLNILVLAIKIC